MSHIRWRKVLRDVTGNKLRSFFVILAIMAGVFGISVVANSYSILMREMDRNYMDTNPSSAIITTDYINDSIIRQIKSLSYIEELERRKTIIGRVQVQANVWKDIWLYVIDDFNNVHLDTFTAEAGEAVPAEGQILFERKALNFTNTSIGQTVDIKIPNGAITPLTITGSVHAPGLPPSWMEGNAFGFISQDTYKMLGGMDYGTELRIKVTGDLTDKQHICKLTYKLKSYLEAQGLNVTGIEIPEPGKHPHYTQMASLLFLMEAFGILALLLSGILVSNMIASLLGRQIRQIGIMKAVGATTLQITALYLSVVIALSCSALLFAIPLGICAGRGYALLAASILNFNIYSYHIPSGVYLLELGAGLIVPVLSSLIPVIRSSRITVREALQAYGVSQERYSGLTSEKTARSFSFVPRPFLLSLRNTFRRKVRLIFTLLVMAAGGTGLIAAMNIYASMYHTVDKKMNALAYDIQVTFDKAQPVGIIEDCLKSIPQAAEVEAWGGAYACRVHEDNTAGNRFNIVAPLPDTKLMKTLQLYSGRWLRPEDTNSIVLNQRILSMEPDIKVGNTIILRINQKDTKWKVIGISKELIGPPMAYVNMDYLARLQKQEGYAGNAVIRTLEHDALTQTAAARQIEQTFYENGISVHSLLKLSDYRTSIVNHLVIIASFLIIMSLLVILVGGLGLATTISINVMERTKEIGIMRATGASSRYITGIVVGEGIFIGISSWFIAILFSIPLSRFICHQFGIIFFEAPLAYAVSYHGYLLWLFLVVLFASAASYYPSRKASLMQINQALYYE